MRVRILLLAALVAATSGCSTLRDVFSSKASKAIEPAELPELQETLAIERVWSVKLGDGQSRQGLRQKPAIEGDRLFVSNDEGRVLALDAGTGKVLWDSEAVATGRMGSVWKFWQRRTLEGGLSGGPGVGNGLVIAGGRNGEVVALDVESGTERWRAKVTSEVASTPLVAGDRVIVRSTDGRSFGLDAADGTRRWVFDRGVPILNTRGTSSPVSDGQLVYLGHDDGVLSAVTIQEGTEVWNQRVAEPEGRSDLDRMADIDGEIAVGYGEVFASSVKGYTMGVATQNGQPLWTRDAGGFAGVTLLSDRVVVSDATGTLWALERGNGTALWKQDVFARRWLTTAAVQGDYLVVGDVEGWLHWVRASDGVVVGRYRHEKDPVRGTPQVSASGLLYVVGSEGRLSAYRLP